MKYYELVAIFSATQSKEDIESALGRVREVLKKYSCEILRDEDLGRFRLAYQILRVQNGQYHLLAFQAEPAIVNSLNKDFALGGDLVRFSITESTEKALKKKYAICEYEAPTGEKTRKHTTRGSSRSKVSSKTPLKTKVAPSLVSSSVADDVVEDLVVKKPSSKPTMTTEEVEREIDKILEEKIL